MVLKLLLCSARHRCHVSTCTPQTFHLVERSPILLWQEDKIKDSSQSTVCMTIYQLTTAPFWCDWIAFLNRIIYISSKYNLKVCEQIHVVFDKYHTPSIKQQTGQKRGTPRPPLGSTCPTSHQGRCTDSSKLSEDFPHFDQFKISRICRFSKDKLGRHSLILSGGTKDDVIMVNDVLCSVKFNLKHSIQWEQCYLIYTVFQVGEEQQKSLPCLSQMRRRLIQELYYTAGMQLRMVPEASFCVALTQMCLSWCCITMKPLVQGFYTGEGNMLTQQDYYPLMPWQKQHVMTSVLFSSPCIVSLDVTQSAPSLDMEKKSAFKVFNSQTTTYLGLATLGTRPYIADNKIATARRFVGALYGDGNCKSLNNLKCEKALKLKVKGKILPPTENAFQQHLKRASCGGQP